MQLINMIMIYYWNKKKKIAYPGSWYNNDKKNNID